MCALARLHYAPRVEEAALTCLVPSLLLQSLVENAVTHDIAQSLEGGRVRLEARRGGESLLLAIENPRDAGAVTQKRGHRHRERVAPPGDALRDGGGAPPPSPRHSFRVDLDLPAGVDGGS